MAKVQSETVVITFSKLVKDSHGGQEIISDETMEALEQVAQELVGEHVIVEITKS